MIFEEILPFYVLDAVTDKERAWVDEYLFAFPEEVANLSELQNQVSTLNQSAALIEPRSEIKHDLMVRIAAHPGSTGIRPKDGNPCK